MSVVSADRKHYTPCVSLKSQREYLIHVNGLKGKVSAILGNDWMLQYSKDLGSMQKISF